MSKGARAAKAKANPSGRSGERAREPGQGGRRGGIKKCVCQKAGRPARKIASSIDVRRSPLIVWQESTLSPTGLGSDSSYWHDRRGGGWARRRTAAPREREREKSRVVVRAAVDATTAIRAGPMPNVAVSEGSYSGTPTGI